MILAISPLVDVDRPFAPRFGLYEAALTLIRIRDGFERARDDGMVRAEHLLAQDVTIRSTISSATSKRFIS